MRPPPIEIEPQAADTSGMDTGIAPGSPAVVMRPRANPPEQLRATFVSGRDQAVALNVGGAPGFAHDEDVFVVVGAAGNRLMAPARFAAVREGIAVFALQRQWQPFDGRPSPRTLVGVSVEIRSVLGTSRQDAIMVDVSAEGLVVEVESKPGGRELEVHVGVQGFSSRLPCEVTTATPADRGVVLHLRFLSLTPVQQAFVRNLVSRLRPQAGSGGIPIAS